MVETVVFKAELCRCKKQDIAKNKVTKIYGVLEVNENSACQMYAKKGQVVALNILKKEQYTITHWLLEMAVTDRCEKEGQTDKCDCIMRSSRKRVL